MLNLKLCPYRQVDDEGHILCDKIKTGDREVSPNICRACPVAAINCNHLRATLNHQARPPLTVRYGNGKTEIWDAVAPSISLQRAACAVKVTPIHSPRDCAGCPIRQPLVAAKSLAVVAPRAVATIAATATAYARQQPVRRAPRVAPAPPSTAPSAPLRMQPAPTPTADARSNTVAQKIIQLQEWLAGHKTPAADAVMPLAVGARPSRVLPEEKRVGWTD
jgi:hypothetical protein